jgi:predicted RNase H-like nuclease (RuvC/YqgF family)
MIPQVQLKNSGTVPKAILVERPVDPGWPNIEPKSAEKTRDLYRFAVTTAPGKPATLAVVETKDVVEQLVLRNLDPTVVDLYIRSDRATATLREALKELLRRKTTLEGLTTRRSGIEQSLRDEATEQQRLRDNLKSLAQNDELQQRYVKKLAASEDLLESLRQKLSTARTEEDQFKKDFEKYATELVVP